MLCKNCTAETLRSKKKIQTFRQFSDVCWSESCGSVSLMTLLLRQAILFYVASSYRLIL